MQPNYPVGAPMPRLIVGGASVRESKSAPPVTDDDFSIEQVEITDVWPHRFALQRLDVLAPSDRARVASAVHTWARDSMEGANDANP